MAESSGSRRFLKHSSIYAFGSILKNIVGFLMLPLYTRYLSPADYGVISLMLLMLSLFELLFGARLGYALPKMYAEAPDEKARKSLISTALIFMAAVGCVTSFGVFGTRRFLSELVFGTTTYVTIVSYFSAMVLTQSLETHGMDYIRLQQRPWMYLGVGFSKLAIQLTLNVWFLVGLNRGVLGVALSTALSSAIMAVALLIYVVARTGIRYDHALAKRMLAFSWPIWFGALAGLYIGSANRYYMRIFGSIDDIGLYAVAERFSGVMTMLIWGPFAQYWVVESFKYYYANKREAFNVVFCVITGVLMMAGMGVCLFAPPTIRIMSQPAFFPSENAVPFLVMSAIFSNLSQFASFGFLVKEKTRQLSAYNYLTAVVVSVLYVAMIPFLGFVGAALASSCAWGLQFLIQYRQARHYYDMGLSMSFLFFSWGVAAVAYLAGNFIAHDANFFVDLAVRIVAWTAGALIISYRLLSNVRIRQHALDVAPAALRPKLLRFLPSLPAPANGSSQP